MKKYLSVILFFYSLSGFVMAQNSEIIKIDSLRNSLRIDSLKRILATKKDTARINCLNKIAETFLNHARISSQERADSAFFYSEMANREASERGFTYGEAHSLIILAKSKWLIQDREESETLTKQALPLAVKANDDLLIGKCFLQLGRLKDPVENYQKAVDHLRKTESTKLETEAMTRLCMAQIEKGQYEAGFPNCETCMGLALSNVRKDASDEWGHEMVTWSYMNMYDLFKAAGDYETALQYLQKANKYAQDKNLSGWGTYGEISDLYCLLNKQDSAIFYWKLWKRGSNNSVIGHQIFGNNILANIYVLRNQPDSALSVLENSLLLYRNMGKLNEYDEWPVLNTLFLRAKAYLQKKDYNRALSDGRQAVKRFEYYDSKPKMMEGYELLSSVYYHLGRHKNAYETLVKYEIIRDSIQTRQLLIRLNNYKRAAEDAKKESRIGFLDRDNQIKRQELRQQATLRNFLIAVLIAVVFAGMYIFRNIIMKRTNERLRQEQQEQEWKLKELESENRHVELQRESAELEMQALRAQMNPHFIFNSLSSINHFILKNESKTASTYLTRFSRLIRMVLINSQKSLVSLDDELQMLELYLEMERLRFKNSFDYSVTFLNTIDSDNIFIPPLLFQPFCENAIWHGLMHKEGQGKLDIELSMENSILSCTITDNGIGREKAEEMKSKSAEKEKSMGLKITEDRLNLLNRERGIDTFYQIQDLQDEYRHAMGTRVNLKISYRDKIQVNI